MKLTIFLIIVFSLRVSAGAYAQRVSLSLKNATLEKAFEEIRKQSPYDFVYHDKFIRLAHPITLDVKDIDIDEALHKLFAGQPFRYEVVNHIVTIQPRITPPGDSENLILAYTEVRGRVVDSLDQPLSGASVRVVKADGKRTTLQTKTDRNGYFVLPNVPADAFLEITFVGYVSRTIGAAMDVGLVMLRPVQSELEEVEINMGYYKVRDKERTGSISRVTAKDIDKQPVLNVMEALKGRMVGVDIQQHSGEVGTGFTIRIRGQNSLRPEGNEPLYLIDGVPFTSESLIRYGSTYSGGNPLNVLNPADVASIEVLKDADATAIYGSRGSNGVVLITTKKGLPGRMSLTANLQAGESKVARFMHLLNTEEYLTMRREAFANNPAIVPNSANAKDLLLYDTTRYTDWQQVLLGNTARNSSANISLTGGGGGMRYLMSGSYLKRGNVYPGDFGYRRGSGHASVNHGGQADRLQMSMAITYTLDRNEMPNGSSALVRSAHTLPPNAPTMLDENGRINYANGLFTDNPMVALSMPYKQQQRNSVVNATLDYRPMAGLELKIALGYNQLRADEEQLEPASSKNPANNPMSSIKVIQSEIVNWNVEPLVSWSTGIAGGLFQSLLGGTMLSTDVSGLYISGIGFENEELIRNLSMAETLMGSEGSYRQYRYLAGFARLHYSHSNRYFLNLTARRDGSSRFGPAKRWGNFGAVGAAWLFGQEAWIKDWAPIISLGKLRASYGITGSDQISDYGYLATYSMNPWQPYQVTHVAPVRLANDDYHWETTRKLEAALEFGLFKDRISGTVAWYRNRSGNQLVGYPLPAISGFTSVQANLPATVQNSGWEFEVHSINLKRQPWEWTTGISLTLPKRKLLAFPGIEASSYANSYQVGKSMDRRFAYVYLGMDPETGVYQFADIDGSGGLNTVDRVWHNRRAVLYGGISQQLSFHGLSLSLFVQIDRRHREYQQAFSLPGQTWMNQPAQVMARWQKPGDITDMQKFWTGTGQPSTAYNAVANTSMAWDRHIFFARLSNVALGWDLPDTWCGAIGIAGGTLSLTGQNLWVSGNRNIMDPEVVYTQLPPLRTVNGGIKLIF